MLFLFMLIKKFLYIFLIFFMFTSFLKANSFLSDVLDNIGYSINNFLSNKPKTEKPDYTYKNKIEILSKDFFDNKYFIKAKVKNSEGLRQVLVNNKPINFNTEGDFRIITKSNSLDIKAYFSNNNFIREEINLDYKEKIYDNVEINKEISFMELEPKSEKIRENDNAVAIIIGIENYKNSPDAKYADKDAKYFKRYVKAYLGIKDENIKLLTNDMAARTEIKKAFKLWLMGHSELKKLDIFIFFAGHGYYSKLNEEFYLLPFDGEPKLIEETGISRKKIIQDLEQTKANSITIFFDACFSGLTRENKSLMENSRPLVITRNKKYIAENIDIFSSSKAYESSNLLPESNHGLFSYFLMKGLEGFADLNNDNNITNGELFAYLKNNVIKESIRLSQQQTPTFHGKQNRILIKKFN